MIVIHLYRMWYYDTISMENESTVVFDKNKALFDKSKTAYSLFDS